MFSFLRKDKKSVKKEKIIIDFDYEQLDLALKILNNTRNKFLKQGILFDEVNEIYQKLFIANCNEIGKIIINETQFNILINVLNKFRLECEQKNINTLALDYMLLEIITQKEQNEPKRRQVEYAR